jgi:hypothetical protein
VTSLNAGSGELIGQTSARQVSAQFIAFLEDLFARNIAADTNASLETVPFSDLFNR